MNKSKNKKDRKKNNKKNSFLQKPQPTFFLKKVFKRIKSILKSISYENKKKYFKANLFSLQSQFFKKRYYYFYLLFR